jgi:hypothetical protein
MTTKTWSELGKAGGVVEDPPLEPLAELPDEPVAGTLVPPPELGLPGSVA